MKRLILLVSLLFAMPLMADVQTFQVTIGASGTSPVISSGNAIVCRWIVFQNNSLHNERIGDKSVTASKGLIVTPQNTFYVPTPSTPSNYNLNAWYVAGTPGDILDIDCESGL